MLQEQSNNIMTWKKVEIKKKDIQRNGMIIQQWVMKLINIMNCPNEHHIKSWKKQHGFNGVTTTQNKVKQVQEKL